MSATILVTGATGLQGGAVARRLLGDGWVVRALVRDLDAVRARELAALGVDLAVGHFDDPATVELTMRGVHGVYSMQPSMLSAGAGYDHGDEIRHGRAVADSARRAGVEHLVYASVAHAGDPHRPVFAAKGEIEQYLLTLPVATTVLRPVSFMENYTAAPAVSGATLSSLLAPTVREQLVAVADIAAVAALAFNNADRFAGQALTVAGDELTPVQIADAIGAELGTPVAYVQIPVDAARLTVGDAVADTYAWINRTGRAYDVDMSAARALNPAALTFPEWLRSTGAAMLRSAATG
jgi:uncharacterized protein YbjT (DUF2867 family)